MASNTFDLKLVVFLISSWNHQAKFGCCF